jgi:regulatory protein
MKTVTDIKPQKGGKDRANVFLDGTFAFSVSQEVLEHSCITPGQTLTDSQIADLTTDDSIEKCLQSALRLLNYRPRSEVEIRIRLGQRFTKDVVDGVISRLTKRQLIDDFAFATYWKENRESFNPRGRRLLRLELSKKGVSREVINEVLEGIDEEESAYRAARKKERSLQQDDYDSFRRKLGSSLKRRGFSYEVADRTVERIWRETRQSS